MSGLPTPPVEDGHKSHLARKASKHTKSPMSRSTKRSPYVQDHVPVVVDGRHKRVWKACERCRMKKTKCDGESPCKRCKDDGLVCTAGSRKKTEFKQLPRGYAEVLENTQYALIATVQKLYTMVRNNESWDLGEPELNERGQPVIHDIASRLGCIRPSPDLPVAFPEGAGDFAELQAQLRGSRAEMGAEETGSRRLGSSPSSPSLAHTERASSTESDHSQLSKDYNQPLWVQQQHQQQQQWQTGGKIKPAAPGQLSMKATPLRRQRNSEDDTSYASEFSARASFETTASDPPPVYTDFQTQSPMFRKASPFPSWTSDDFLGQPNALDLTAQFMRTQQYGAPLDASSLLPMDLEPNVLNYPEGTITPHMLDCNGYDPNSQMDNLIFGNDYENQMGRA